jgi:hypothetical protein
VGDEPGQLSISSPALFMTTNEWSEALICVHDSMMRQ